MVDKRPKVHTHQFMINQTNGSMFVFVESLSNQKLDLEVSFASLFQGRDIDPAVYKISMLGSKSGVFKSTNELNNLV